MKKIYIIITLDLLTSNTSTPICFETREEAILYCEENNKNKNKMAYSFKGIDIGKFKYMNKVKCPFCHARFKYTHICYKGGFGKCPPPGAITREFALRKNLV